MKHASSPIQGEYTLCGLAWDVGDSGDEPQNPEFGRAGEVVDCVSCRLVIAYCGLHKGFRVPTDREASGERRTSPTSDVR